MEVLTYLEKNGLQNKECWRSQVLDLIQEVQEKLGWRINLGKLIKQMKSEGLSRGELGDIMYCLIREGLIEETLRGFYRTTLKTSLWKPTIT